MKNRCKTTPFYRPSIRSVLILVISCILLLTAAIPLDAQNWITYEGDTIVNGLSSGAGQADAPGEVSVKWQSPKVNGVSYNSPDTPKMATVDHVSEVRLDTPTLPGGSVLTQGDSVVLNAGDTVDIGVRLVNTGNGPDTYGLSGVTVEGGTDWDTEVFLDSDEDSSASGEQTVDRVADVDPFGPSDNDTGLVLRVSVPSGASPNDTRMIALRAESSRASDPEPGRDTASFRVAAGAPSGTTSISLVNIELEGPYSTLLADGSDTIIARAQWYNSGTNDGTVQTDTDNLKFFDSQDHNIDGFEKTLASDTEITVRADSFAEASWVIHAPDTSDRTIPGSYNVRLNQSDTQGFINVASVVNDLTRRNNSIDKWSIEQGDISLKGGERDGNPSLEPDAIPADDDFTVMYQRGDSTFVENPIANPDYGFESNDDLRQVISEADEKLKSSLDDPLDNTLFNISFWKNRVGGTYLGHSEVLREDVTVTVDKPEGDLEDVKVAKLLSKSNEWHVIDENPEMQFNSLTFTVSVDEGQEGTGFSVFRLVTGPPISEVGSAEETQVYPNPFVPYDGDPETGEYGLGNNQGIFFATGENSGFPAGTHLKIYTVAGELIAEERTNGIGRIQWDGRTRDGDFVASGTYVYQITTPDGLEKVGKFSVIR